MAIVWDMIVEPVMVGASVSTLYTVPSGSSVSINQATACNTDASARTLTVHLVPDGGSASATNTVIKELSLAAGETKPLYEIEGHLLTAGMTIRAAASAGSVVSLAVSGMVRT